jgi:hypothetical protein
VPGYVRCMSEDFWFNATVIVLGIAPVAVIIAMFAFK